MDDGTILIENAQTMYRNFAGRAGDYNSEGDKNFCVKLPPALADQLIADGWNVKYTKVREEGDEPEPYVHVKVEYGKGRPPRCVMITSKGRTDLGADEVGVFDFADIKKVDVIIRPYRWEVNGNKGVKAYLKTLAVWLNEDEIELRLADMEEAQNAAASRDDDPDRGYGD